jgi:hypothetical protein
MFRHLWVILKCWQSRNIYWSLNCFSIWIHIDWYVRFWSCYVFLVELQYCNFDTKIKITIYTSPSPNLTKRNNKLFSKERLFATHLYNLMLSNASCGNPLCWPRDTLYPQKLALTSPTRGGSSVGTVLSRTQATKFIIIIVIIIIIFFVCFLSFYSSYFLTCANFVIGLWALKFCT